MLKVDDNVLKDIGRGFSVPAQPDLLLKLRTLSSADEPNINEIAALISQDVALSATILKTINSPLYGLARTISDIPMSVRYIGLSGIVALVTSNLISKSFDQKKCNISLEGFWDNAANIAQIANLIGERINKRVSREKLFSLGLFHDCGIPVMSMKYKDYAETLEHAEKNPSESLVDIEESVYKVNHATIGYYVASSWRLPIDICQLILRHHDRKYLEIIDNSEEQICFAIFKMAEHVASLYKYFRPSSDWAYVQDSVLTILDLDEEDVQDILDDSSDELMSKIASDE